MNEKTHKTPHILTVAGTVILAVAIVTLTGLGDRDRTALTGVSHGWPLAFACTILLSPYDEPMTLESPNFTLTWGDYLIEVHSVSLLVDLVVALILLYVTYHSIERWAREHEIMNQFRLRHLTVLIGFAATVLAEFRARDRFNAEFVTTICVVIVLLSTALAWGYFLPHKKQQSKKRRGDAVRS